jgi:hypothetical protein
MFEISLHKIDYTLWKQMKHFSIIVFEFLKIYEESNDNNDQQNTD